MEEAAKERGLDRDSRAKSLEGRLKEAEKLEEKSQERMTSYDEERKEYAQKIVNEAKEDLQRELDVLK